MEELIKRRLDEVEERRQQAHVAYKEAQRLGADDTHEEAIRYDILTALRSELRWVLGLGGGDRF